MTTQTLTITEFLGARLAEDLVLASWREWHTSECDTIPNASGYSYPCDCGVPERMKREVEAKRRIVELHEVKVEHSWENPADAPARRVSENYCDICGWVPDVCDTVKALASVYADHEDFREEWRADDPQR